jgi:hypothetical protein
VVRDEPGVEVIALTSVAANLAVAIGARLVAFRLVIAGAALMPAQHGEQ